MARHQIHLSRHRPVQQACLRAQSDHTAGWFAGILAFLLVCLLLIPAQAMAANRSLKLYFTHTKETTTIVYKRNGKFDADGLRKLNRFLRDWRRNESTQMDPALFDLIWQVYKETGAKKPIHVVSAYRSPATNNMLRSRSRGVAQNSRHTKGQAMDFYLPGVSVKTIRNVGLRMQAGGVGYYPSSRSPFVHIDTGNVRHWPRMSRKQLAKVFPKGKTVHVPRDGKPFSGYKVAKAQAAKRKAAMVRSTRSVRRFSQVAKAAPSRKKPSKVQLAKLTKKQTQKKTSLMQTLLSRTPKQPPKPTQLAKIAPAAASIAPAPINLQGESTDLPRTAEQNIAMPRNLATLPKRPRKRPVASVVAEAPATPSPSDTIPPDEAVAQVEDGKAEEPVKLAFLPRARPVSAQKVPFQLASAEPISTPKAIEQLASEQTEVEKSVPVSQALPTTPVVEAPPTAEPVVSDTAFTIASLPKAKSKTEQVADATATATKPAQTNELATLEKPDTSASEILANLAKDTAKDAEAQPSNRFAYAASDETFVAALPSKRPRAQLQGEPTQTDIAALPKNANRTQLASLAEPEIPTPEANPNLLAALPKAAQQVPAPAPAPRQIKSERRRPQTARMDQLTFAFGPSGMAHFAHMKQSTKTATFARLSRPIPNNLRGLVSQPSSMVVQSFSHQTSQQVQDGHFAGAAIARMAIRSFN